MNEAQRLTEFSCPLCQSNGALLVLIFRDNKPDFRLPLYQCQGCTVVFTDLRKFETLERNTLNLWDPGKAVREIVATRTPPKRDGPA